MNLILIIIISVISVYYIVKYYKLSSGVFQFPFLISCVTIGFVLVQVIGIYISSTISEYTLTRLLIMICLCSVALAWGFEQGKKMNIKKTLKDIDLKKSKPLILIFLLIGLAAYIFNRGEYRGGTTSGEYVLVNFFTTYLEVGLILVLFYKVAKKGNKVDVINLLLLLFILIYLDKIILTGRRNDTIRLFLILSYVYIYMRDNQKFKFIVPIFLTLGSLLSFSTQDYRNIMYDDTTVNKGELIRNIDFKSNLKNIVFDGGSSELKNAAVGMEIVSERGFYDMGLMHWNSVVHNFIPAQILGADLKSSLMFDIPDVRGQSSGYVFTTGSTMTGYYDAFSSFGYFGFVKFILIGFLMGIIWRKSLETYYWKLIYLILLTPSLHIVTHSTNYFFITLVSFYLFINPFLSFIKTKKVITNSR